MTQRLNIEKFNQGLFYSNSYLKENLIKGKGD